jgi:hypothetical protein
MISFREAYLQQDLFHETIPYPVNWLQPANSDPEKYDGVDAKDIFCPKCNFKLVKDGNKILYCEKCNGRYSNPKMDKSYSQYATDSGLLSINQGSNVNNQAGGINYHNEPVNPPSSCWTGNLGR